MISGLSWGIASVIVVLTLVVIFVIRNHLNAARSERITNQRYRPLVPVSPEKSKRLTNPYTKRRSGDVDLDDMDTDVDIEDVIETTSRSLLASELMDTPSRSAPVDNFEPVRTESNYSGGSYDSGGGSSYDSGGGSFD